MKVELLRCSEIGPVERMAWGNFQQQNAVLQSPYFCFEFIDTVSQVRDDVQVAVLKQGGEISAFFPFQKDKLGNGRPVGGALADFHGLIGPPNIVFDSKQLLTQCGLHNWTFHHLPEEQVSFNSFHRMASISHLMDLSKGFDNYAEALRANGSGQIKDAEYKLRKLQRDHGDVRFVPDVDDLDVLRLLMEWKSEQYLNSGFVDQFAVNWIRLLMERLFCVRTPTFSGMLSALYVNGEPAALHFGMRTETVWNWWFPRHNEKFKSYSPGILLRVLVAEHAAATGIQRIDLGCGGTETYKPRLSSGGILVAQGTVERPSFLNSLWHGKEKIEEWGKKSIFKNVLRVPGRVIRKLETLSKFR
ncbi:MAG: GNAT family N-acetyltransferase [Bacteroidia bacterium]|nr:GNAT family N-acetyltransferase [Bacteroidia bacterium]